MGFRHGVGERPGFKNGASESVGCLRWPDRGIGERRGPEELGVSPQAGLEMRVPLLSPFTALDLLPGMKGR